MLSLLVATPEAEAGWWDDFVDWVQEFFVIEDRDEAVAKALEIVGENISYTKDYEHIEFLYEDGSKSGGAITLKNNGYAQEENSKWRKRELATNLMKTYGITFQDTDYYHKLNFISYNATEIILETQGLVSATNIPIYFYENYYNDTTEQIEKNYLEFEIEEITNGTDKVKHGKKKEHKINLNTGQKKTFSIKGINLGDPQVNIHTGYASNKATGVSDFADAVLQFKHDPGGGSCTAPNWRDVISGNFSSGSFTLAFASSDSRSDAIKVYCDSGDSVQLYRTYMGWDIPSFVYDQFDGGSLQLTMDTTPGTFVVLNGTHNLTLSNNLATWNAYQGIPLGEGNMTMNGTNNLTFSPTDMDKFIDENGFTGLVYRHKQYDYDGGFADVASDTIGLYFESASAPNTPILTILYSINAAPTTPANVLLNSTDAGQLNKSNENLQANADVLDPDGDPMNCNIDWFKDGVNQTTLHDSFACTSGTNIEYIFDSANTTANDLWAFAITSVDSLGKNSTTVYSNNVTIQGTISDPTVLINSTITAQTNYTNETLSCFFSCDDDVGGNTITYDLEFRNQTNGIINNIVGASCTNPSSNTVNLESANTTAHEFYSCNVNLTNSVTETTSTIFSQNLTVEGTIPNLPTINLPLDNQILIDSNVTLNVSATDPDDDPINFEIYRNSTPTPTTLISNATYNVGNITDDGSYYYRIRVGDRDGVTEYTSDLFITVDNSTLKNETTDFPIIVTEGSSQTILINISHNLYKLNSTNATLKWDNTIFSTTQTNFTDSLTGFSSTFTVPAVSANTVKEFNWSVDLRYVNGSVGTERSQTYTQTVNDIGFFSCDGITNSTQALALNFTFAEEINNTAMKANNKLGVDFEGVFEIWKDLQTTNNTLLFDLTNQTEIDICITPPEETFSMSATLGYETAGFDQKQYYFDGATISNNTNNITLYQLSVLNGVERVIKVEDSTGTGITDALIFVDRYYNGENVFRTVAMGRTDDDGKYNIFLKSVDASYKFKVLKGGVLLFTDIQSRNLGTNQDEVVLKVKEANVGDNLVKVGKLNTIVSNTSSHLVLDYATKDGSSQTTCFSVIRRNSTSDNYVCNSCETSASGSLMCDANLSGTYFYAIYSDFDGDSILVSTGTFENLLDNELIRLIGNTGIYASFFIILSFGLVGVAIRKVSAVVGFTSMGIIFTKIIGFLNISWEIIVGVIIIGGVFAFMAKD